MTLERLLFEPTLVRSPGRVVQWWESRRPVYNAIVGTVGLGTFAYASLVSWIARGDWMVAPWQIVVAYGVAANLFYTLGWAAEIGAERWLKRPVYGLGPALFRHGLVFSIGLTIFPAALVTIAAIAGAILK
jgi:hypothetical protein